MENYKCILVLLLLQGVTASFYEESLQNHLFTNYKKYVRPVENPNETVVMNFGLAVTQLLDVDEKNQIITTGIWMDQYWADYRLQWNSSDYGGIESVIVPFEWVWYPDLVLDNSADGDYLLPTWKYVTLYEDGQIWVTPPGKVQSPCSLDVKYFPFDEQFCILSFGPWEFTAFEVIMKPINDYVPKENYIENVEWVFFNSSVVLIADVDECCPDEAYSTVEYTLVLRRRPRYYILNILFPCIAMSVLTLAVFYLPPDSGEKMTLSISVLIALSVFSLLVADIMPPSADSSPLIGNYLLFIMTTNAFSIFMSVIVLHFNHRSCKFYNMPRWIRTYFLCFLPKYIGLGDRVPMVPRKNSVDPSIDEKLEIVSLDNGHETTFTQAEKKQNENCGLTVPKAMLGSTVFKYGEDESSFNSFQKKVVAFIEYVSKRMHRKYIEEELEDEWKQLATVVDRICLIIFFLVNVVGSLIILLNAPGIYR